MYCIDTVQMASVLCMQRTTSKHESENFGMRISKQYGMEWNGMEWNGGEENVAD